MSTFLSRLQSLSSSTSAYLSKRRDMQLLLQLDNRTLSDISISREMLEQGVKAWPWRLDADLMPLHAAAQNLRGAVKELESYSDADLADLGLNRGNITEAVLHGRAGIDQPGNDNGLAQAA